MFENHCNKLLQGDMKDDVQFPTGGEGCQEDSKDKMLRKALFDSFWSNIKFPKYPYGIHYMES